MLPERFFIIAIVMIVLFFVLGIVTGRAQERLLSDVGTLTEVQITPCYSYSTLVVDSKELGCSIVFKRINIITGSHMFIAPWPLNKDGLCACPEREKE